MTLNNTWTKPENERKAKAVKDVERELIKMAELARRSGVPAATIKHYIREQLLPEPAVRTSPNMAYYDASLVPRIKTIKRLQRSQYLPLKVIKEILEKQGVNEGDKKFANALHQANAGQESDKKLEYGEIIAAGLPAEDLDDLEWMGYVQPEGKGQKRVYSGQDVALIEVLHQARMAGLSSQVFPVQLVKLYLEALRPLVRFELQLFRQGVLPKAPDNLEGLAGTAANVSETLVTILRRRLILPTLTQLLTEENASAVKQ